MCAWYLPSGRARLRRCPEVEAILDELRDPKGDEFEVIASDAEPGELELTFRGGSEFTEAGADELDALLASLGPHATEPAVFTGEYDGELRVIPIDPPTGRRRPRPASRSSASSAEARAGGAWQSHPSTRGVRRP